MLPEWISGRVTFEAEGGMPEYFLNRCAQTGLRLTHCRCQNDRLTARCTPDTYKALRTPARRSGLRLHILRRYGLPFFVNRYRGRYGLLLGLLAGVLLIGFLSGRVWRVTVSGNESVSTAAILAALRPFGVSEGAPLASWNNRDIQLTVLKTLPQLTWISVNTDGCAVSVEVKEYKQHPTFPSSVPANLVAMRDGRVLALHITGGQAAVKEGDAVTAGELLVSGVVDSKIGPLLRHAAGTVTAQTTRTLTVTIPFNESRIVPTREAIYQPSLVVYGFSVPLFTSTVPENAAVSEARRMLNLYDRSLPIGLFCRRYQPTETIQITLTPADAHAQATRALAARRATEWNGVTVLSEKTAEKRTKTGITLTVSAVCQENIAVSRPIS